MPLLVKCGITYFSITLRKLVNLLYHFSVSFNSDSEILTALQAVETVVRTQRHRLDADTFLMFSVRWTWQGFCRELDPRWSE